MTDPFWYEDRGSSMIHGITNDIRTRRGKSLGVGIDDPESAVPRQTVITIFP